MFDLFYRKPRLLLLFLAVIAVAGGSAYRLLPRLEDPEIRQRWALIVTAYPGATADRVETLITREIEDELQEMPEIDRSFATSRNSLSIIRVFIKDAVTDIEPVWTRVRDRMTDVQPRLPKDAGRPDVRLRGLRANSAIVALQWTSSAPVSYPLLRRLAEELEADIARLPGTQYTALHGAPSEEVRVEPEPAALAALGLDPATLARIIDAHDTKDSAGRARGPTQELSLELAGAFDSVARVRAIPVGRGQSGAVVTLGEVAEVRRGVADPPEELAIIDGRPAVAIAARMQSDRRIDLWAAALRRHLDQARQRLPRGITLKLTFDQSRYTQARLSELQWNLALAAGLVFTVVLIMMGWKSAVLVGASLPLSVLMVLAGMRLLDVPMHQMSVTGLIIALGMLIDNAIVIVDEVRGHLRAGRAINEAITRGVRHLAIPLLGSTLTTVFTFLPLVLMEGGAGEFVGSIAITVILALVSSLFLALTVIPALTGFLERRATPCGPSWWRWGIANKKLSRGARRVFAALFQRPILAILISIILPLAGFLAAGRLEEQFFPPADRDQVQVVLRLPASTNIATTYAAAEKARVLIEAQDGVIAAHFFVGGSAPSFYYNMTRGEDGSPFYAQALVQLASAEGSAAIIDRMQDRLDAAFPEAQCLVLQLEQGPPFEAPIELRIFGPDLDALRAIGERARARLAALPDVVHTRATLGDARPKLRFDLEEDQASQAGLDPRSVAGQLAAGLSGAAAGTIIEDTEELAVRVRLAGSDDALRSFDLIADGRSAPLSAFGDLALDAEAAAIPHYSGRRCNTVQAYLRAGVLPQSVLRRIQGSLEDELDLPAGYSLSFGGENQERDRAINNLLASVSLLLVLMVATLVLSFNSFRMAALIGAVGVLSVGLGLLALFISGYPFGFTAIIGTMGLVGVAINDSIVVLAALLEDPRARAGDRQAVLEVVLGSTRHVLSTTVTTIAGFIPLLLSGGGFWPPLAVAIGGGVAGATLLALTAVPAGVILLAAKETHESEVSA